MTAGTRFFAAGKRWADQRAEQRAAELLESEESIERVTEAVREVDRLAVAARAEADRLLATLEGRSGGEETLRAPTGSGNVARHPKAGGRKRPPRRSPAPPA